MTDAFTPTRRKAMTPQRRARIFAARDGICGDASLGEKNWGCGRKLRPGDWWQVEHGDALENGGEDTDENCYVGCEGCVARKNRVDHALAAKGRRRAAKHTVPGRHPKRGFQGWKGFDGRPIWAKKERE